MEQSWYGKPVEEVDPLIFENTFCVISKKSGKNYIHRFSSTKSLYLFGPLNPIRKLCIYVTTHRIFEIVILVAILANCITLGMTTNYMDPKTNEKIVPAFTPYIEYIEFALLGIYSLEVIVKVIAKGFLFHKFSYLRNRWNVLDFIVVTSGYATIFEKILIKVDDRLGVHLDFLKTFRVLRVIRTASLVPGLKMMINALISAVTGLVDVLLLSLVFIANFSIFAQELFQGKLRQKCVIDKGGVADPNSLFNKKIADEPEEDRDRLWTEWVSNDANWKIRNFPDEEPTPCGNLSSSRTCGLGYTCVGQLGENPDDGWTGFDNFFISMLSILNLMTFTFWDRVYDVVLSTSGAWSLIFFLPVTILGGHYLMNLMLAVVSLSYENVNKEEIQDEESPHKSVNDKLRLNRAESNFSFDDLSKLNIKRMSKIPKLNPPEESEIKVRQGFARLPSHVRDALENVFLEVKESESDQEQDHHHQDPTLRTSDVAPPVLKLNLAHHRRRSTPLGWVKGKLYPVLTRYLRPVVTHRFFELFITSCIVLNTICLAMEHHGASHTMEEALRIGNHIFMAVFTIEFIVKLLALQKEYFENKWNVFDMVIVLVSYMDLALVTSIKSRGVTVIRSMRLLRVFKLAHSWVTMKVLLNVIFSSFGALGNLIVVLFIIIYIFAVMGMQIVGGQYIPAAFEAVENPEYFPRLHWANFWYAFMTVFRVMSGDWLDPLIECLKAQTNTVALKNPGSNPAVANSKCFVLFFLIEVVGTVVVLNLFLALLLESFDSEELKNEHEKEMAARRRHLGSVVNIVIKSNEDEELDQEELNLKISGKVQIAQNSKNSSKPVLAPSHSETANGLHEKLEKMKTNPVQITARRRFKFLVRRVIRQVRRKKADHLLNVKTKKNQVAPKLFLSNPWMKGISYENVSEESLRSVEDLTTGPGDCFPSGFWTFIMKYLPKRKRNDTLSKFSERGFSYWYSFRLKIVAIVSHYVFDYFILVLIFASSITLCFEDIHLDERPRMKRAICILNYFFTIVFIVEMFLKIVAIGVWGYFTNAWTLLDAFIVAVSLVSVYFDLTLHRCSMEGATGQRSEAASNLGALRAIRTLRALRPLRAVSRWEGMKMVVNALFQSIPSIFNVLLVCLIFWLVFAIMGVQFFKGQFYRCIDKEGARLDAQVVPDKETCCAKSESHGYSWINTVPNYDNVFEAYLTLLQVASIEGWVLVMTNSVDTAGVDRQPVRDNQLEIYLFYVLFVILGSFFTLQLFIGVIIDNFNELKKKYEGNMLELLLTPNQRKYYISMKNVSKKRPRAVIRRPKVRFRAFFYDIAMSRKLEVGIFILIFLDLSLDLFKKHDQSLVVTHIVAGLNAFFTYVYILEALIKILGLGTFYFTIPWNVYDFILVICTGVDIYLLDIEITFPLPPILLRVVRVLRIGKILRKFKAAKGIYKLLSALIVSLPAMMNIGALLALITFIYAILGMAMFGGGPKKDCVDELLNFDTFFNSNLMLFRLMTGAGWDEVNIAMTVVHPVCGSYRHMNCGQPGEPECPNRAIVVFYIVSYLIITHFIVINLYIAVILENFEDASSEENMGIFEDDLDMFYNRWAYFDPDATQFLSLHDLSDFLDSLDPPLRSKKPNNPTIAILNIPIARGDKLHCLDILQALINHILGSVEHSKQFKKLQRQIEQKFRHQFPTRQLLDIVNSTGERTIERIAAIRIQRAWRAYLARKKHNKRIHARSSTKGL